MSKVKKELTTWLDRYYKKVPELSGTRYVFKVSDGISVIAIDITKKKYLELIKLGVPDNT